MTEVVIKRNETVSAESCKDAINIVVKDSRGVAGVVVKEYTGGLYPYKIEWSNTVHSNSYDSLESLIAGNDHCKFYLI